MDESVQHDRANPYVRASVFSKIFFCWLNPLMGIGYKRDLEIDDMYNVVPADEAGYLGRRLESEWQKGIKLKRSGKPSLLPAIVRIFGKNYALLGFIVFVEEGVKVVQPLLLGGLISYFTPSSTVLAKEAYLYAFGVSICTFLVTIVHHTYYYHVVRISMQIRIACCSLLYRKLLHLSHTALAETTTGQVVNIMTNDVNRFDQGILFLHYLWVGPLQALAAFVILWYKLGPATLTGFLVLIFIIPLQGWMGTHFSQLRLKTAIHTDKRIQIMNEIISSIRIIKMYCWEKPFGEMVKKIRKVEDQKILMRNYLVGLTMNLGFVGAKLCVFGMVAGVVLLDGLFLVADLYVAIAVFETVRRTFVTYFSRALSMAAESKMAFERVKCWIGREFTTSKEFYYLWLSKCLAMFHNASWFIGPHLMYLLGFIPAALTGRSLLAASTFVVMQLLFLLSYSLIGCLFMAFKACSEAWIAIGRIKKFLELEEVDDTNTSNDFSLQKADCGVMVKNITARWDKKLDQLTLERISLSVSRGELLAVIGPVGSGKSSLLMAIIGELPLLSGDINIQGNIGYVSQQPWVFSASLRQNILFGKLHRQKTYDRIISICALKKDLEGLPHGDRTLIGERGVTLSGGQKARVNLARVLYMETDVYLLDDPLSAVDAAVGRHLFDWCIKGFLKDKPCILVTHQLQYLKEVDQILILKEGKAVNFGTYDELLKSGVDFATLLKQHEDLVETSTEPEIQMPITSISSNFSSNLSLASVGADFEPEPVQVQEEELRHDGKVGIGVFIQFFKAGGGLVIFLLIMFLCIIAQVTYVICDWWLSYWVNEEESHYSAQIQHDRLVEMGYNVTNITISGVHVTTNILVYTGLTVGVFVLGLLRVLLFYKTALVASNNLHNLMYASIMRTPMRFFDTNPVGRILNRFTKDVGQVDEMLPIDFFDFIQCFFLVLGVVIVAGIVNPYVFLTTLPLFAFFIYWRQYYMHTSRSTKRLEAVTRSPVYSHISATFQGLYTVRALKAKEKFVEEFDNHQNLHTEAMFLVVSVSRWLAVRLEYLCVLFITTVAFCSVPVSENISAGFVGLSLTYAIMLMGMFQWGIRQSAVVENQMVSVERILEYTKFQPEASLESGRENKPPQTWPESGAIVSKNMSLQYSKDGPVVLKDIDFLIRPKEKIGIVGRTGAGKSSLITALFRLFEPNGEITIDGIDICKIGLHDLRKKISIIPQDAMLFSGSLRKNLDPFHEYKDEELWSSLEAVQLKLVIKELPGNLDWEVPEGGTNFSVGQRQLVCLARALLRNNQILIIDEATANVDMRTDALIQETIRKRFCHCTVLTIAHRLNTVMDSDRIMVLSDGRIVEFDEPRLLLENHDGHFYKLVQQMGKTAADHVIEMVQDAKKMTANPN